MVWEDYVNNSPIAELNPLGKIYGKLVRISCLNFIPILNQNKINNSLVDTRSNIKKFWREEIRITKLNIKMGTSGIR